MSSVRVSILIPNYNKEPYLENTLNSILNQTFQDWECIFVDDRSTDGSLDVLRKFEQKDSRIKVLERPSEIPKGANFCRNYAFSQSQGELIQWFDSDDEMYPWYLERKVHFLQENPEFQLVVSKGELKFEKGFTGNRKFQQNFSTEDPIEDYLKFRLVFFTAGPLVRRSVFEAIGLFNLKLRRHQEWELFFRVVLNHPSWGVIEEPSFLYLVNNNSITSRHQEKRKVAESELVVFQQVLSLPIQNFKYKISKKTRVSLSFKYLQVATYYGYYSYAFWYFNNLLKELVKKDSPILEIPKILETTPV